MNCDGLTFSPYLMYLMVSTSSLTVPYDVPFDPMVIDLGHYIENSDIIVRTSTVALADDQGKIRHG